MNFSPTQLLYFYHLIFSLLFICHAETSDFLLSHLFIIYTVALKQKNLALSLLLIRKTIVKIVLKREGNFGREGKFHWQHHQCWNSVHW